MGLVSQVESSLYDRFRAFAKRWIHTAIEAVDDYYHREFDHAAASVSFYAIFSIFPLMAFLVFAASELTGSSVTGEAATVALGSFKQVIPAIDGWIEQALLDVLRMSAIDNWLNGALLAWSGASFFAALQTAISLLPPKDMLTSTIGTRSRIVRTILAALTLGLCACLGLTLILCEFLGRSDKIPVWLQGLPYAYQDIIYWSGRSGVLLAIVSISSIAAIYKILVPCKLSFKSAVGGAVLCSGLLVTSRSLYWIYLHYQGAGIQTSYGAFSKLILNMLWIHFVVNCVLFCCLFALHLDRAVKHTVIAGKMSRKAS